MRLVIALTVAIASAVIIRFVAMFIGLQMVPPRCQPVHGPGFHTLVCIVDLRPQLVAALVASWGAGAVAFVAAWRWTR